MFAQTEYLESLAYRFLDDILERSSLSCMSTKLAGMTMMRMGHVVDRF